MGRLDHGTVPPDDPAAHADASAGESFEVDAIGLKRAHILARHADGEIAFPVAREIEIDAPCPLADAEHPTLDQLIGLRQSPETIDIVGALDAIDGRSPHAEPFCPRLALARQQLSDAGAIVGKGIDAGEPCLDHLLLQPEPACAIHHEDVRERIAVAVGFGAAVAKLDLFS